MPVLSLLRFGFLNVQKMLCRMMANKKGKDSHLSLSLPDLDSNQDILNQNQLYYPYTIGQSSHSFQNGVQK